MNDTVINEKTKNKGRQNTVIFPKNCCLTMAESIQTHDHNARRRREQAEQVSYAVDSIYSNDVEFINLDDFRGCHYNELHIYNKNKGSSQGDEINPRSKLRRDQTTGYSPSNQCKQFGFQRIHTTLSIGLRREQSATRYVTLFRKCQPEMHNHHKKDRKNLKTQTVLQRNMSKNAETGIILQPITTCSTPGITPASPTSSSPQNLTSTRLKKSKSHSLRYLKPIKEGSVRHRQKKSHDTNKTSTSLLPKHCSKLNSRRRPFFITYSKILFLQNKRRIKPKQQKQNRPSKNEINSVVTPAVRKINKIKPCEFARDRLPKMQGSSLRVNLSSSSTDITLVSGSMMQNFCDQGELSLTQSIPFPKPISAPYAKTITVYSVFDQKPKNRKGVDLTSNASFNMKFYKSMGDGRQMFGDGSPYMQIPRNYSPTDVARGGRDEDGCICVSIPPENYYECMGNNMTGHGGNFLKRYLQVLLHERKRCICANKRPTPKSCLCPNVGRGRIMMPTSYSNSNRNSRANDVSCQCKRKERRERRSDDIYCRDRGTTCSVPTCPEYTTFPVECPNTPCKDACNIGSNFSFQVGLYKRCIDTNPDLSTVSSNYMPSVDGDVPYGMGAPYGMGRGGDDCNSGTSNGSVLSELLSPRCTSPCSMSKNSSFLKQLERTDLCCNYEPKSHCKPKYKPVRCKCNKKPKVIGCGDSKKNVGIVCSLKSSTDSASCSCYKVKNIGCCCSNDPIVAECKKKKNRENKENIDAEDDDKKFRNSKKFSTSRKPRGICRSTCTSHTSMKKGKRNDSCKCRESKTLRKGGANCCHCGENSRSILNIFCRRKDSSKPPCCCSNEQKFSFVRLLSSLLERSIPEKSQLACECSSNKKTSLFQKPNSGEFNYKELLQNLRISSKRQKQAEQNPCGCGSYNMKKVLSDLLAPDPTKTTQMKAQQCECNKFDVKKMMEKLLLSNTVNRAFKSYSKESYDEYCRSIGIGEEDYRKLPPFRVRDRCQGDGFTLKKIVSKLIYPEGSTRMHYSAFNPFNQCEAAMQHNSRLEPVNTAGATVCRNQGSCVGRSKPLTVKDCDNATCAALKNQDPNRKAVRIGSSCSFCLEIYKGMPPSKASRAAPGAPTNSTPCAPPCAPPINRPCRKIKQPSFLQRTACALISSPYSAKKKDACKKCDTCVKVPLIKRGFANLLLRDRRPLLPAKTCQKTNTIQTNRKIVTRKPTGGKGKLGATPNCDPYVCLKRLNQRKCCR